MLNYSALNTTVAHQINGSMHTILDVGCGTGEMGTYLKNQVKDRIITGITYSEAEAQHAKENLDKIVVCDLNTFDFNIPEKFDCIIFSHVLEHLYDPVSVLKKASKLLNDDGVIVVALPNVLFFKQRLEFLKGNFKYSKNGGLMDETHYRFFDWDASKKLLAEANLKVTKSFATGSFPLPVFRKIFSGLAKSIDNYVVKKFPSLFGFQFIITAKK